jgi:hypothetical protein
LRHCIRGSRPAIAYIIHCWFRRLPVLPKRTLIPAPAASAIHQLEAQLWKCMHYAEVKNCIRRRQGLSIDLDGAEAGKPRSEMHAQMGV